MEKKVVTPASPLVVDAGTNVGPLPPSPPEPPLRVVVLSPEMIVVKPLPMIVVIAIEVIVLPSITVVAAACSMVRVMVAEQAHEVW